MRIRNVRFAAVVVCLLSQLAFADCESDKASCESTCGLTSLMKSTSSGAINTACMSHCSSVKQQCDANEARSRAIEAKKQKAASDEMASKAAAEAQEAEVSVKSSQDYDSAMEKGMQALDQKNYLSAEYQFKKALTAKHGDLDALGGIIRAQANDGHRESAIRIANDALFNSVSDHNRFEQLADILVDCGISSAGEKSDILRFAYEDADPKKAAGSFKVRRPHSQLIGFVEKYTGSRMALLASAKDQSSKTTKSVGTMSESKEPEAHIETCDDEKFKVVKLLNGRGKWGYTLQIISSSDATSGEVMATCENGTKKIVYISKN